MTTVTKQREGVLKKILCFLNHLTLGSLGSDIAGVGGAWSCRYCADEPEKPEKEPLSKKIVRYLTHD